jgi:MFS family permease
MSKVIPLEKRGTYFGMRNSISIAFQAGAGYVAGLLVGQYSYQNGSQYLLPLGYALCFFLAFLVHAIDLWALSRIKEEPALTVGHRTTVQDTIRQIPSVLKADQNFSRYCILRSLISLSFYTSSFIIVFAKNRIEVTGPMLGIFTAVNLISLAFGTFVSGQIANRIGFKRLIENVSILMALVYFLSPFLNTFVSFFLFFMGVGFLTGGIFLSFDNLIMEFGHADNRPIYIAIASIISGLSGVVGPLAAGLIANRVSFTALFLLIGAIILTAGYFMRKTVTDPRDIPEYWI